jgi:hypothetical protein
MQIGRELAHRAPHSIVFVPEASEKVLYTVYSQAAAARSSRGRPEFIMATAPSTMSRSA